MAKHALLPRLLPHEKPPPTTVPGTKLPAAGRPYVLPPPAAPGRPAPRQGLNRDQCTKILKEFRITSGDIVMRGDYDADAFIDVVNGDCKYMPALYVMNKIDQLTIEELDIIDQVECNRERKFQLDAKYL